MSRPKSHKPKYCFHKSSGRAYVRISGQQIWLGKHGTQASKDKYDAAIGQWISQGRPVSGPVTALTGSDITIVELVDAYWTFAKEYYKSDPMRSDGHRVSLRGALDLLVRLFGTTAVSQFGPLKLAVVRDEMIKPKKSRAKRRVTDPVNGKNATQLLEVERPGWTRGYTNAQLMRLKRMFAWGVAHELIPAAIYDALDKVEGLRKGKTAARESSPIRPAREEDVNAVLPLLPPPVRAMIELERITGMRPGEVRIMQGRDIELGDVVWVYRPRWHKTEHHGVDHVREIFLGPKAQAILRPYIHTLGYLFTPHAADQWVREQKGAKRKTPMTPSQRARAVTASAREREFEPYYSSQAYARCVKRGCKKAGLGKSFTPNMLRHTAGTQIRNTYGLDGAQVILGHRHAKITEMYAETNRSQAIKIMSEAG